MEKENDVYCKLTLVDILKELENEHKKLKALEEPFEKFTLRFQQLITECTSSEAFNFYLKQWFETFLNFKDECFLLMTGSMRRKYHVKEFEKRKLLHKRNAEERNFKSKKFIACSYDGWKFEAFIDKEGYNKRVSTLFHHQLVRLFTYILL